MVRRSSSVLSMSTLRSWCARFLVFGFRARAGGEQMQTRVGITDVAARAGVAASSVSRVLAGHPDVSAAMRQRVLRAAKEIGYEPNTLAQSLRRGVTMSVALSVG